MTQCARQGYSKGTNEVRGLCRWTFTPLRAPHLAAPLARSPLPTFITSMSYKTNQGHFACLLEASRKALPLPKGIAPHPSPTLGFAYFLKTYVALPPFSVSLHCRTWYGSNEASVWEISILLTVEWREKQFSSKLQVVMSKLKTLFLWTVRCFQDSGTAPLLLSPSAHLILSHLSPHPCFLRVQLSPPSSGIRALQFQALGVPS